MLIARAAAAAVLLISVTSCTGRHEAAAPPPSPVATSAGAPSDVTEADSSAPVSEAPLEPPVAATLPPGALLELVPSAADLPPGYDVTEGGGPRSAQEIADLADDPANAMRALQSNGFKDCYSADYGNVRSGAYISVQVMRFNTDAGARADYARQVQESAAASDPLQMAPVGDESAAFREKVPEGDVAEIVSVRFRVKDLVWLIETGGQDVSDISMARDLATKLVRRTS
ncbi:MAG: hypothetical protein ABI912_10230 [Actinomycetota bacterium]